jgi:hypothetical protein
MKKLLAACWILVAAVAGAQTAMQPSTLDKVAEPSKPRSVPEENPILKGAQLKTEWRNVRNPFRFEINENRLVETERIEQMHIVGYTRMSDETGILRTYAFVTKTSEGKDEKKGKAADVVKETLLLQAFPEIVNESTIPTEEQAENSSISLTSEQLWFLGIVVTTNKQALAIFWPYGSYPIKEDSLRQFEIQDRLKDLPIRVTKAGEKIGGSGRPVTVLSKPKSKSIPAALTMPRTAAPPQATNSLPPKPLLNGVPDKTGETALSKDQTLTSTATPATRPPQNPPPK